MEQSNEPGLESDLLEEEVLREASRHGPQWNRDKHLLVEGEPAATVPRFDWLHVVMFITEEYESRFVSLPFNAGKCPEFPRGSPL